VTLISYLIVAYKSRRTIGAAVKSVLQQTGDFEKEIIVIDNSAGSSSAAEVLKLAPSAMVIVNCKNRGFTRAVNQAVRQARGDCLFIMNPDVTLTRGCTSSLLAALQSSPRVAAVAPQLRSYDDQVQPSIRNFPGLATLIYEVTGLSRLRAFSPRFGHWRNLTFDYGRRTAVQQPMASALLVKEESARALGDWDEQFFVFFSDVDYCRRLHGYGYQILYEPAAVAYHLGGGATRQEGSWLVYDSHAGYYRYLVKHEFAGKPGLLGGIAEVLLLWGAVLRDLQRKFWGGLF
jgi:GT2 family glycosyltransferase